MTLRRLKRLLSQLEQDLLADAVRRVDRLRRGEEPWAALLTEHLLERRDWLRADASAQVEIPASYFADARTRRASANLIRNAWQRGQRALSVHFLDQALKRFALSGTDPLARLANEMVDNGLANGWVGIDARLQLIGRLSPAKEGKPVHIVTNGEIVPTLATDADGRFRARLPRAATGSSVDVAANGLPLLGGPVNWPPPIELDGQASLDADDQCVTAWLRVPWLDDRAPRMLVRDDQGAHRAIAGQWHQALKRWHFRLALRQAGLAGEKLSVEVELPDGRALELSGSPLIRRSALQRTLVRAVSKSTAASRSRKLVDPASVRGSSCIVVVLLDARDIDARPCLEALLEQCAGGPRLIVADLGSPDALLIEALEHLAAEHRLELLRFDDAPSHSTAVNRIAARHPAADLVLTDARAVLMPASLERLQEVTRAHPECGTVSMLSNQGSPLAYPLGSSHGFSLARAASLVEIADAGIDHSLAVDSLAPACVLIRRACLDDIGDLDDALFPHAEAALIDLAMQARRRRWRHRLATRTFAYVPDAGQTPANSGGLTAAEQTALTRRHSVPVESLENDTSAALPALRRALDEHQLAASGQSFVLILSLARGGGVDRFVAERCAAIRRQGLSPLLLRAIDDGDTDGADDRDGGVMLWTDHYPAHDLRYHPQWDLEHLGGLLARLPIAHVELQHFLGIPPAIVERCLALPVPFDVYVHDYIWICPRITLMGPQKRYCGEPASTRTCDGCVQTMGSALGPDAPSTGALRRRSQRWLAGARAVFVPNADVAQRLGRYFPSIRLTVRALEPVPARTPAAPRRALPLRVALLGALTRNKGYEVLLRCARHVQRQGLPVEFVLIGSSMDDERLIRTGCVSITGPYADPEVGALMRREQPDLVWLPSVWPETWSYTLSHAIQSGLPIVAYDLGAIGERIRALQCGILLPLNASPRELVSTLMAAASKSPAIDR